MPDSKTCVASLLRRVPFNSAKVIVEFGSATGTVTREIIKRKKPETIFISFEKNENLHGHLIKSIKGENSFFINEDAFDCLRILNDSFGIKKKALIVSFQRFPAPVSISTAWSVSLSFLL